MTSDDNLQTKTILAIDPGRSKCGIAVLHGSDPPRTDYKAIVATDSLVTEMALVMSRSKDISAVVIGDGTESKPLQRAISDMFPRLAIFVVNEHGSSQRARRQYLLDHPARGWRRLLPIGLRTPDKPYDDTVAELLAQDFLATQQKNV